MQPKQCPRRNAQTRQWLKERKRNDKEIHELETYLAQPLRPQPPPTLRSSHSDYRQPTNKPLFRKDTDISITLGVNSECGEQGEDPLTA